MIMIRYALLYIALLYIVVISLSSCYQEGSLSQQETQTIRISNLQPRTDVDGEIVDLHDGRVIQFGDRYYWYGTTYGSTTGFVRTNHYRCYSSEDMQSWRLEGRLLDEQPSGIYYRPHVIYNETTEKYVLWYNWYPRLWTGRFGVATSDTPTGPFTIIDDDVQVHHSDKGVGDFNLYVDDDGQGYIMYNTISGHQLSVERLAEDYLTSTGENGGFIASGCEAGSIFKRDDLYYLLTDYTCCFCTQGSGARVYMSDRPTDGYTLTENINRYPGQLLPGLVDGDTGPTSYTTLRRNDQGAFANLIIEPSSDAYVQQITLYQHTGNRSGMCGDTTAERVHELIDMVDLTLEVRSIEGWTAVKHSTEVKPTSIDHRLQISLEAGAYDALRLSIDSSYSYDEIYLTELELHDQAGETLDLSSQVYAEGWGRPIIPAQQTHVMTVQTPDGPAYLWMGDLWGSASDNIKGHDYQYWGAPMTFDADGHIERMQWTDEWSLQVLR